MACSSHVGASYPVLVHRLALLLRVSFGPSVAGTPLRFANPSPSSGWVEDFHFQAAGHAQHTAKSGSRGTRADQGVRPTIDAESAPRKSVSYSPSPPLGSPKMLTH